MAVVRTPRIAKDQGGLYLPSPGDLPLVWRSRLSVESGVLAKIQTGLSSLALLFFVTPDERARQAV